MSGNEEVDERWLAGVDNRRWREDGRWYDCAEWAVGEGVAETCRQTSIWLEEGDVRCEESPGRQRKSSKQETGVYSFDRLEQMTRWGVLNQGPSLSKRTSHEHTSMERDWSRRCRSHGSCVWSCTEHACRADVSAVICFLQTENDLFFYLHEEREKSDPIISGHSRCILMPAVNWCT